MATVNATLVRNISIPGIDNLCLYRFVAPSVPVSTVSDDFVFAMHIPAKIQNIRVVCESANYRFSLRQEANLVMPSPEEVYNPGLKINKVFRDNNVNLYLAKPVGPFQDNLYAVITNVDPLNPTGSIIFEFVLNCY